MPKISNWMQFAGDVSQLLDGIEAGTVTLQVIGESPEEIYAGDVEYLASNGWRLWVFDDCGDWDYLDAVQAPDGTRVEFEDLGELQEYRPSDEIRESRYHWTPHGWSLPPPSWAERIAAMVKLRAADGPMAAMMLATARDGIERAIQRTIFNLAAAMADSDFSRIRSCGMALAALAELWQVAK